MMSSSTATISSQTSTMNSNDRKRSISSSLRPSPPPPSAKRHSLSSTSRRTANKMKRRAERPSRSKHQYRHLDNQSSSSESSRSSSSSINQDYPSPTIDSNAILSSKKPHPNSHVKYDTIYAKKTTLIVKPTATMDQRKLGTNYDSNDEYERGQPILTKSSHVVAPSSVMTIVTAPDLSKKSMIKDNVIIQQLDANSGTSTKLVKLVVPQATAASSSIKMLSSNDGLASALRVPTKIQLTRTSFPSSIKADPNSSLISSTSNHSISEESSNIVPDISIDVIEKQKEEQLAVDYRSSTALPLTPPPPVIDRRSSNVPIANDQQEKPKEISPIDIKMNEEPNSFPVDENSNDRIKPKRHPSVLSDWSVPPTSELSPTSLTSSSPDLTQNHLPLDDSLVELDPSIDFKQTRKRCCHSLSSFPMAALPSDEKLLKPIKSKSLAGLSNSSSMKFMLIEQKRSLTSSPIMKLSSSQRIKKRRRDNENLLLNHKTKTKYPKIELDDDLTIQNLLHEMIERITSASEEKDNPLKTLLVKPVPHIQQRVTSNVIPNRQTKSSVKKKLFASSQSVDSAQLNESRPMVITRKQLDELAYLLHANAQRGDYERVDNPTKVEERMRETWSQMSNQKKNGYYKRVIQIYKRPNRDVVITTSPSTNETNFLASNDLIDSTTSAMNPLSVEFKRQTSTPLSFHSLASSTADESPNESTATPNIFTDIVNELIKGAKGLDKLSCSVTTFASTIHGFVRSPIGKQSEILRDLEQEVEKKCPSQFNRASLFWKQKITYFATKHQINSSNESMNELTLIVKYFYLYVLLLNSRKQEVDFGSALTDLVHGNLTFPDETFCSATLTSVIEDLILPSTLGNDYLASQTLIIDQIEHSLPWIRNIDLENDLLNKNDACLTTSPFADFNDLEDYLNRCEHMRTTIPNYPTQQSHHASMYYPPYHAPLPPQYYYSPPPQPSDVNNYYYNPSTAYSTPQSPMYPYAQPTSYYHPSAAYNNNEQYKYYYNQPQPSYTYSSQSSSTNNIPSLPNSPSIHRTYRPMQRTYSNSQQPPTPTTPVVFDPTTTTAAPPPQSKSMNTINSNYPP